MKSIHPKQLPTSNQIERLKHLRTVEHKNYDDIAEIMGIRASLVMRWCCRNDLTYSKVGDTYLCKVNTGKSERVGDGKRLKGWPKHTNFHSDNLGV